MSETQADRTPPTLEVRILRDGVVAQRALCETEAEAEALVQAWSEGEGVVVEVEDLTLRTGRPGVLDPQPWEVDAEDLLYEGGYTDEEDER
jgi:hypothetical protein